MEDKKRQAWRGKFSSVDNNEENYSSAIGEEKDSSSSSEEGMERDTSWMDDFFDDDGIAFSKNIKQ